MEKIFTRGFYIVLFFFGSWFGLQQIDWVSIFNIHISKKSYLDELEEKLGKLLIDDFTDKNDVIEDEFTREFIESIVFRICSNNDIDFTKIKCYVVDNQQVNAFALPNKQLVIYSGLIKKTPSAEALAGVIAHEIAHIENGDVMNSLIREIGVSILFSFVSGGSEHLGGIIQTLSSSAFSRETEKQADLNGLSYLIKANIDPKPFATFIGALDSAENQVVEWISTHPISKERKRYITEKIPTQSIDYQPINDNFTWEKFKNNL